MLIILTICTDYYEITYSNGLIMSINELFMMYPLYDLTKEDRHP